MVFSIIKKSQLEDALRLDADRLVPQKCRFGTKISLRTQKTKELLEETKRRVERLIEK